jgi:hypothetical protein
VHNNFYSEAALQIQHGWYETHKNEREVPLSLAANQLLDAKNGHAGQGVYFNMTTVEQDISSDDATFIWGILVNGESSQTTEQMVESKVADFDRDDLSGFTSIPLLPDTELTSVEACNNMFCCTLDYKVRPFKFYDFYAEFLTVFSFLIIALCFYVFFVRNCVLFIVFTVYHAMWRNKQIEKKKIIYNLCVPSGFGI